MSAITLFPVPAKYREKFWSLCGLERALRPQFLSVGKCMTPNPLYLYMKLRDSLERILCGERRFVLVRAIDFHVKVH